MGLGQRFLRHLGITRAGTEAPLFLYDTMSKKKREFRLLPPATEVRMYHCGPTVYGKQHAGNLSMFVFTDVLRRTLEYHGLHVKQAINFTDFGHLSSDADEGEDKMMKGLKREGMKLTMENMRALGEKYAAFFLEDIAALNVKTDGTLFPRASEHVPAQIAMIRTLEEKGYAYSGESGVYFDTAKFPDYGALGGIDLEGLRAGARVAASTEKRNPTDFLLWKSSAPPARRGARALGWDSPWGRGFPGWHIECSAMINACLGKQIDIHTGGIEHIPVHHNNEIAQSESATGKKPFVRFWMHRALLQFAGGKMAKSEGNVVYLSNIAERGFDPLSFRYLLLGAHYRTPANFTWEALEAAQNAYQNLLQRMKDLRRPGMGVIPQTYRTRFLERINDDLDTPGALATLWEMVKDQTLAPEDIAAGAIDFDRVLGLRLGESIQRLIGITLRETIALQDAPIEIRTLVAERENARKEKDWGRADELRAQISAEGYAVEDGAEGPVIVKT